jgi:AraC-like DNA-binding protein
LFVSNADAPLLDCALRLTRLLDTPQDIPMLAPMIIREIYYRLLMGEQGEAVRQIATSGSNMQRIAEVLKLIKTDFAKPMRVEDLAGQANMSPSSFHYHFKEVTSMSPLQYQKQLRLLEARRLMLAENSDAANAAYQVGYESPSQFSREYSGCLVRRRLGILNVYAWLEPPIQFHNFNFPSRGKARQNPDFHISKKYGKARYLALLYRIAQELRKFIMKLTWRLGMVVYSSY